MEGGSLMFEVFMVNFGFTHSSHPTLEAAKKAAKKTGYQCTIFKKDNPFDIITWVFPRP